MKRNYESPIAEIEQFAKDARIITESYGGIDNGGEGSGEGDVF